MNQVSLRTRHKNVEDSGTEASGNENTNEFIFLGSTVAVSAGATSDDTVS